MIQPNPGKKVTYGRIRSSIRIGEADPKRCDYSGSNGSGVVLETQQPTSELTLARKKCLKLFKSNQWTPVQCTPYRAQRLACEYKEQAAVKISNSTPVAPLSTWKKTDVHCELDNPQED
ncbi:hypothetical protein STEG23_019446 [Scotinomys teguina]